MNRPVKVYLMTVSQMVGSSSSNSKVIEETQKIMKVMICQTIQTCRMYATGQETKQCFSLQGKVKILEAEGPVNASGETK